MAYLPSSPPLAGPHYLDMRCRALVDDRSPAVSPGSSRWSSARCSLLRTCRRWAQTSRGVRVQLRLRRIPSANMPLVGQLFLWFFVLSGMLAPRTIGAVSEADAAWAPFLYLLGRRHRPLHGGALRLATRRSGIAPARGRNGCYRLGLTNAQAYRYVLCLPMAFARPSPLTSEFLMPIKPPRVASPSA